MTRDEMIAHLERQIAAEEAYASTAPVARVLASVLEEVRELTFEQPKNGDHPDQMLRAREVAQRLGVSVRTVYKAANGWPFTKRYPGGSVRFSSEGLEKWLARR